MYQCPGSSLCLRNVMVCAASPANVIFPMVVPWNRPSAIQSCEWHRRSFWDPLDSGLKGVRYLRSHLLQFSQHFKLHNLASVSAVFPRIQDLECPRLRLLRVWGLEYCGVHSILQSFLKTQTTNLTATRRCHQGGLSTRRLGEGCAQSELATLYTLPQGWS
jgi:hypothetical protein